MSRQLDMAIAEALGYQNIPGTGFCKFEKDVEDDRGFISDRWIPYSDGIAHYYSTEGEAMLTLDKEMRERGYEICSMECVCLPFIKQALWNVSYRKPDHLDYEIFQAQSKTEPLARALAAYKALTGKEWEGD